MSARALPHLRPGIVGFTCCTKNLVNIPFHSKENSFISTPIRMMGEEGPGLLADTVEEGLSSDQW